MRKPCPIMFALLLAGCAEPAPEAPETVVRTDSAGVSIVYSAAPTWGEGEGWTVGAEPILDLSTTGSGVDYEFRRVSDVVLLPGGDVAVAEPERIRFYSPEGEYLGVFGREGEGPGEFRSIRSLDVVSTDSLVAFDGSLRRATILTRDRELGRVVGFDVPFMDAGHGGMLRDRFVLKQTVSSFEGELQAGMRRLNAAVVMHDGSGALVDTVVVVGAQEEFVRTFGSDRVGVMAPHFYRDSFVEITASRVVVADADRMEYRTYDSAGALQLVVRAAADLTLTDQIFEAERALWREAAPSPEAFQIFEDFGRPELRPAFNDLVIDATDAVWLQEFRGQGVDRESTDPAPWNVFSPDGAWLGQVLIPGRFQVHEIGEDYVLGVFLDELDVEHVRMLPLER